MYYFIEFIILIIPSLTILPFFVFFWKWGFVTNDERYSRLSRKLMNKFILYGVILDSLFFQLNHKYYGGTNAMLFIIVAIFNVLFFSVITIKLKSREEILPLYSIIYFPGISLLQFLISAFLSTIVEMCTDFMEFIATR